MVSKKDSRNALNAVTALNRQGYRQGLRHIPSLTASSKDPSPHYLAKVFAVVA